MEIREINIMSGKLLPDVHTLSPPEYLEEEKEESIPYGNIPPYPERLVQPEHHTKKGLKLWEK